MLHEKHGSWVSRVGAWCCLACARGGVRTDIGRIRARGKFGNPVFHSEGELWYVFRATMSEHDLIAEIERLKAENEALRKRPEPKIVLKVSQKGALSVYGLGRFPVTLYQEQWERLLDMSEEIKAFIKENDAELKKRA